MKGNNLASPKELIFSINFEAVRKVKERKLPVLTNPNVLERNSKKKLNREISLRQAKRQTSLSQAQALWTFVVAMGVAIALLVHFGTQKKSYLLTQNEAKFQMPSLNLRLEEHPKQDPFSAHSDASKLEAPRQF